MGVLIRFRKEPIAVVADIEAMFHQVFVSPNDRDVLRFLWWPNNDLTKEPEDHQMQVHIFGATSPSCTSFCLKKTAQDNREKFDVETIKTVEKNFYVDDCLKSTQSIIDVKRLVRQLSELLALGGFHFTKWVSNCKEILAIIPEKEKTASVVDIDCEQQPLERTLGIQWNVESDEFGFKIMKKDKPSTRRGILSIVSSVYDPLGFVAPFI